ncbi:hypothetical protein GCM10009865_50370 [Aeromicrobium ponti]|nr:glycosyltransferase [Cytobacillus oceanisediminis]
MKALFCYDGPLRKDKDGNYYGIALNNDMFSRYFQIADSITAVISTQNINEEEIANKYSKINLNNFQVISTPKLSSLNGILFNRALVKNVISEEINKSDFLIVRLPSIIGNLSIEIAESLNKPYFVEIVGCPWDAYWNHSYKGKLIALPSYWAMKKSVKNAPYALYVTNQFLQKRYTCKGRTIGCSDVSLRPLNESVLEKRLHKIKNMKNGDPIIIGTTAAVNVKYKGQEYVIKAISKLNKEGYNFNYYLAGGGDKSYLQSLAEKYGVIDKVIFLGTLPHEKVFEYLDEIDIYIQPSKVEGLPRALVEAMSRGCPSLGSLTGGIPELLNKKLIFDKGSVNEIYNLLKMIDKKIMFEEANRSFEKAKEYNKELLEKKRVTFYHEFIKSINNYQTCTEKNDFLKVEGNK